MNGSLVQRSTWPTVDNMESASKVNAFRVHTVTDRIATYLRNNRCDSPDFCNLCLSLSRGIDYAVAINEIPPKVHELPLLLRQVCQQTKELQIKAATMLLMASVKNACKSGWFVVKDADELMALANELWGIFSSPAEINTEPGNPPPIISKIMSRFFPRTKMGLILASLEVKSGFGAYVVDFLIPKNIAPAPQERIRLFVAQTDNILTSSCLISPSQVNFVLNGRGLDRRINISMDSGPQFPTNITNMLKVGTNLLQAVGTFNGNYIIIVAFMNMIEPSGLPLLQDYVQPTATSLESDSEIIEGPSLISLNCPISFTRINTPVKGQLCKHRQCFDYDNFIDMNSRRPSWRCPHCNQSVCYPDIRIDQNMVKVLNEVGENVAVVIISSDGSWKPAIESGNHTDDLDDKTLRYEENGLEKLEPMNISNNQSNFVDLTVRGSDDNDAMDICEVVDRKPSMDALRRYSAACNVSAPLEVSNTSEVAQNATHIEDDFWRGILLSVPPSSNGFAAPSITEPTGTNRMLTPVLTDAISPALNREPMDVFGAVQSVASVSQSQFPSIGDLPLQQLQVGNSIVNSELGRPCIPRNVIRNPVAVQALPAQSQIANLNQRQRSSSFMPNGAPSVPSQTSPSMSPLTDTFNVVGGDTERQQQYRSLHNPFSASDLSSSSMQYQSMTQNWDHQDRSYVPNRSYQHIVGLPASSQVPGAFRGSPGLPSEHQTQQQTPNMRMPQMMHQPPAMVRPSTQFPAMHVQQAAEGVASQAAGNAINQNNRFTPATQRATQTSRSPPSVPVQLQASRVVASYPMTVDGNRTSIGEQRVANVGGMVQPVSRTEGSAELSSFPSEQNWRPTGRMRGSLSGPSFSSTLNQYVIRPTHLAQAARPPAPNLASQPGGPSLQVLLQNNRNSRGQPQ